MNESLAVEVANLTKYYGELLAVDHITFSVREGEIFGLLGPNGAGKTTTVRILAGVIKADGGSAHIMRHPARSLQAKQMTGVVPELTNAYPDLSARNNLMFMTELYGISASRGKKRADQLLKELDLYERKDQLVRTFSRGMKQRLILCMALVNDPQVLFLDEPTSGLDVRSTRLIRDMLREFNKNGRTVFLTTHDMEEANQLCDRVAIMNHGKIAVIDTPMKLRSAVSGLHSVEVSFDKHIGTEALSGLAGVNAVRKEGDRLRLYASEPSVVVASVVDYARSTGLRIIALNILTPSLEEAFVELTEKGEIHGN